MVLDAGAWPAQEAQRNRPAETAGPNRGPKVAAPLLTPQGQASQVEGQAEAQMSLVRSQNLFRVRLRRKPHDETEVWSSSISTRCACWLGVRLFTIFALTPWSVAQQPPLFKAAMSPSAAPATAAPWPDWSGRQSSGKASRGGKKAAAPGKPGNEGIKVHATGPSMSRIDGTLGKTREFRIRWFSRQGDQLLAGLWEDSQYLRLAIRLVSPSICSEQFTA